MKHPQYHALWAAMLCAGLLTACGGDGGGGGGSDDGTPPPATTAVSVSGVAAKGLLANADVGVYAVQADGRVASTALKTTTTGTDGRYALSFDAEAGTPLVVVVSARADGTTTHVDEATGTTQVLPAGFQLRALLPAVGAGGSVTASANITPFSELAVAAAAKAGGGLTAANIRQATSTVVQLLGFDPAAVAPKPAAAATTPDEQKLAVLLTAVSELARAGALGCTTGDAGAKTACIVHTLGAAARADSLALATGEQDVAAALAQAVRTVLASPTLSAGIAPSALVDVQANLACSGAACTPAAPVDLADTAAAIAYAKQLFTDLRSDVTALFARGGTSASSPVATVNNEAFAFQRAMRSVQVPAEVLLRDSGALLTCIDHFNDFRAGRTQRPTRGRAFDTVAGDLDGLQAGVGCTVYQDAAGTLPADAPGNAVTVGAAAYYHVENLQLAAGEELWLWRHGFMLTPGDGGAWRYVSRATLRVNQADGQRTTTDLQVADGQPREFGGTLATTLDAQGRVVAFTLLGELPGAFAQGGTALVSDHHAIELSGTRDLSAGSKAGVTTASGRLVAYADETTVAGTLTVHNASAKETPVSRDADGRIVARQSLQAVAEAGGELAEATLDLVWTTADAEFEGAFAATDAAWDAGLVAHAPTKVSLSGALRNIAGGAKTTFLAGQLAIASRGYAAWNATLPASATNNYTLDLSFSGQATAPGRPVLDISLGASGRAKGGAAPDAFALSYRSLVNGAPRSVLSLTAGPADAATGARSWKLAEAAGGLTMGWTGRGWLSGTAALKQGTTTIGSYDAGTHLLTFVDNSFVSLDAGL